MGNVSFLLCVVMTWVCMFTCDNSLRYILTVCTLFMYVLCFNKKFKKHCTETSFSFLNGKEQNVWLHVVGKRTSYYWELFYKDLSIRWSSWHNTSTSRNLYRRYLCPYTGLLIVILYYQGLEKSKFASIFKKF